MKLYASIICVVLLLMVAAAGHCQTARSWGMGGTGLAVTNDAGVVYYNPAGLPWVSVPALDGGLWGAQAVGAIEVKGDTDYKTIGAVGVQPDRGQGIGGYWGDDSCSSWWGVSYGQMADHVWSWGAGISHCCGDTIYSAGFLYRWQAPAAPPVNLAFTIDDITDQWGGPFFNVGAALPVASNILVAADLYDITNEDDTIFNIGAEVSILDGWCVRGGLADGDLTLGVGYRGPFGWTIDAAYINNDSGDDTFVIGGSMAL